MQRASLHFLVFLAIALTACGVNPVTGKKELQFVSEAQELKIGADNYSPTRQSEGGEFVVMPELSKYVSDLGRKLAAVADRQLPYEFVVLNNSVPNAWALPGGKIAVNRGLLTELKNESELAAVLGHEIVHAAARHGAKAQERGTLLQAGLAVATIGAAVSGVDSSLAGLMVQGAGVGSQLIQTKYGRDQELEADHYGMKYMKLAGYDPAGAITLQETFVRLSEQGAQKQSWVEGLFASHPPSPERVAANKKTADELGRGGEVGTEKYAAQIAPLLKIKPAYDKHDQALAALRKKDFSGARSLTNEAIKLQPREGRFQETLGEISLAEKQAADAIPFYQRAIELNPDYFGSYLGAGVAQFQVGNKAKAEEWLTRSAQLLPTAPAAYYLGNVARERGDQPKAMEYYRTAASSNSAIGQQAAAEFVRMDLPQNPANYVAATAQFDSQGRMFVVVQNRAPIALSNLAVTPVLVDGAGRILQQGATISVPNTLKPGEQAAAATGIAISQEQLPYLKFKIEGARVAQ